jgi:hypothetical protein
MMFLRLFTVIILLSTISCKKEYTCSCTNSNGTYDSGTVERKTKNSAKKDCEALSAGETSCSLK